MGGMNHGADFLNPPGTKKEREPRMARNTRMGLRCGGVEGISARGKVVWRGWGLRFGFRNAAKFFGGICGITGFFGWNIPEWDRGIEISSEAFGMPQTRSHVSRTPE